MYYKIKGAILVLLMLLLWGNKANSQSIIKSRFGKGVSVIAADTSFSMKFSTRFQTLYQGVTNPTTNEWDDNFTTRRFRLKFDGFAFSPKFVYKIELALSNRDIGHDTRLQSNEADNIVLDAVAKWNFAPNLYLWVGQTKLPGNRERVISSQNLQFVDRSLLNARFNIDRDAGVQLHHVHQVGQVVLREVGAITMGEGRNITVTNMGGYDYTARVEVLPFGEFKGNGDYFSSDLLREQTPKLSVAATYDYNDNASREGGQLGDFLSEQRDLSTVFVDAMFKYRGFSFMGEYADKEALSSASNEETQSGPVVRRDAEGNVLEAFTTGDGLNLQAGYLFKSNWEVAGRYSNYNPTPVLGPRAQDQYTIGISKYIVGHSLKVQSDVTLLQQERREDAYMFRMQMEISL
ncbi:porin [Pontibacter pamirensis]|uniref:porin n=1 Tax=Pontibacter pamirensis TaxID=2562824 RepID=UPI001F2435DA|nr:porin [Pontibacter pamirensis]